MSSNINDYVRPTDVSSRRDINKILSLIHDLTAQDPEEEGLHERIMLTPEVRLKTSTVIFAGADFLDTQDLHHENWNWRRKKPAIVKVYDLVHTQVGAGALLFPVDSTWFGARCDADGTNYMTIDDDVAMNGTTEITVAIMVYLPASGGGFVIAEKENEWRLRVVDTNTIEFAIYSSGAYKTALTYAYTINTKYSIVGTYKSTSSGQTLYVDGSSVDSDAETGAINNGTKKIGIMARGDGTSISPSGVRIAAFHVGLKEASTAWVTSYHGGLLDTSDGFDEVTTIFFTGDDRVTPDAETGLFKSS